MHAKSDESFEDFVKQQFSNLATQMSMLVSTLAFTVKRVKSVERALNFKVVTPGEAEAHNLNSDDVIEDIDPHIDTSSSIVAQQCHTINGLRSINEMQQKRLKSFTATVNTKDGNCN
jgi:hypothetical protein